MTSFAALGMTTLTEAAPLPDFLTHDQIVEKMNQCTHPAKGSKALTQKKIPQGMEVEIPDFEKLFPKAKRRARKASAPHLMSAVAESIDLREYDAEIKKQPNPNCTAYGLAAVMENWVNHYLPQTPALGSKSLSEKHIFSQYKQYDVEAAIHGTTGKWIVDEEWWPEKNRNPYRVYLGHLRTELVHTKTLDHVEDALAALDRGNPVYIGMSVPLDMSNYDAVICGNSAVTKGGHAIEIAGYHIDQRIPGGGYFIVKNSWGPYVGDHGYQYLNFDICRPEVRPDMYCYFWEIDEVARKAE